MIESSSLNLADVAEILWRRRKPVIVFVFVSMVVSAVLLFFVLPKKFKAESVVVAANPMLADKARMFNTNIESLYSNFGSGDDLDRIYGMAKLDTVYKVLVKEFDLVNYYKATGNTDLLKMKKAISELREDVFIQKNELSQLRVIVWNKSSQRSAAIANRLVELTENILADVWRSTYKKSMQALNESIAQMQHQYQQLGDSASAIAASRKEGLVAEIQQYQKAADEFGLAANSSTPALIVLERAYPAAKATKPDKIIVLLTTLLLSTVFGIITVLIAERKK